jgi:hypothetical protein
MVADTAPAPRGGDMGDDIDPIKDKETATADGGESLVLVSDTALRAHREGLEPAFLAKVELLNGALAEIGMGRYQYELFISGESPPRSWGINVGQVSQ